MISRLLTFLGRHIDRHLLAAAAALMLVGLITLYSASGESLGRVAAQLANIVIALCVMWLAANIPPHSQSPTKPFLTILSGYGAVGSAAIS